MTDDVEFPADESEEEPGRVMGSYSGTLTLRDPRSWDVSRANRPIEPPMLTVEAIEKVIDEALTAAGFAVKVSLVRTDR